MEATCSPPSDLVRIVLLGKTGVGKSATGNTILRNDVFRSEMTTVSVTKQSQKCDVILSRERNVSVVDTPDFFFSTHEEDMRPEIKRAIALCDPGGAHALVYVMKPTAFTTQEIDVFNEYDKCFGTEAIKHTILLFTYGDELDPCKTIEELIEQNPSLSKLIQRFDGRWHVINNKRRDRRQVSQLLEKIDNMVAENGGSCYTTDMLLEVERRTQEEQDALEEERRREEETSREEMLRELDKVSKEIEEKGKAERETLSRKKDELEKEIQNSTVSEGGAHDQPSNPVPRSKSARIPSFFKKYIYHIVIGTGVGILAGLIVITILRCWYR